VVNLIIQPNGWSITVNRAIITHTASQDNNNNQVSSNQDNNNNRDNSPLGNNPHKGNSLDPHNREHLKVNSDDVIGKYLILCGCMSYILHQFALLYNELFCFITSSIIANMSHTCACMYVVSYQRFTGADHHYTSMICKFQVYAND
jgi:hypothetical protein